MIKNALSVFQKNWLGNIKDNFVDGHVEVQIIKNPSLYIKKGYFVYLGDTYYGIIKACEFQLSKYNRTCTVLCYVDVRCNQYFGPNSNIICNELRLATDEEKEAIINVMRANGMTGMDGKSLTIFMKETNVNTVWSLSL